ncbi:MAG: DUF465 domain-containing protein [Beijerinckiaceae bacterium]
MRHRLLEAQISHELKHARPDPLILTSLKKARLRVRDEMERLQRDLMRSRRRAPRATPA